MDMSDKKLLMEAMEPAIAETDEGVFRRFQEFNAFTFLFCLRRQPLSLAFSWDMPGLPSTDRLRFFHPSIDLPTML